jgi:hypothetical protein
MLSTHNLQTIHNKRIYQLDLRNRVPRQAGAPVRGRAQGNLGLRLQDPCSPTERDFRCCAEPKSRENDASGAVLDGERRVENGSRDDIECMGTGLDVSCVVNGTSSTPDDSPQGSTPTQGFLRRSVFEIPSEDTSQSIVCTQVASALGTDQFLSWLPGLGTIN